MILPVIEIKPEIQWGTQGTAKQGASLASGDLESFGTTLREATQLQGTGAELKVETEGGDAKAAGVGSGGQSRIGTGNVQRDGTASSAKSTLAKVVPEELASAGGDRAGVKSSGAGEQSATLAGGKSTLVPVRAESLAGSGVQTGCVQAGSATRGLTLEEDPEEAITAESGWGIESRIVNGTDNGVVSTPVAGLDAQVAGGSAVVTKQRVAAGTSAAAAAVMGSKASASKNAGVRVLGTTASLNAVGVKKATAGTVTDAASGLAANGSVESEAAIVAGAGQSSEAGRRPSQSLSVGESSAAGAGAAAANRTVATSAAASAGLDAGTLKAAPVRVSAGSVAEKSAVGAADAGSKADAKSGTRTRVTDVKYGTGNGVSIQAAAVSLKTGDAISFSVPVASGQVADLAVGTAASGVADGVATGVSRGAGLAQTTISNAGADSTTAHATSGDRVAAAASASDWTGTLRAGTNGANGTAGPKTALVGSDLNGTSASGAIAATSVGATAKVADEVPHSIKGTTADAVENAVGASANTATGTANAAGAICKATAAGVVSSLATSLKTGTGAVPPQSGAPIELGRETMQAPRHGVSADARPVAASSVSESSTEGNPGAGYQSAGGQTPAANDARAAHASHLNASSGGRSVALTTASNATANTAEAAGSKGSSFSSAAVTDAKDAAAVSSGTGSGAATGHATAFLPAANTWAEGMSGSAVAGVHGAAAVRETGAAAPAAIGSGLSAGLGAAISGVGGGSAAGGLSSVSPGDGTAFAEPHRTLLATPTALEVGVPNGTQGWVKIRAEVGGEGQVNASLAAGSSASQEMLHRQLPALNAYLHSEQISVITTLAERSFGGERSGSGAGEAGKFQSNSGGANAGSANAGGGSNGSSNPAMADAREQSGAHTESVSGLTSSYDGRAGMDSAPDTGRDPSLDAGLSAALSTTLGEASGGSLAGAPMESGQWLNVRA